MAFQDHLLSQGIRPEQIISINFEDLSYVELTEAEKLYHYIIERLSKSGRNYVFLDEIQHVRNFERAVDSLFLREDVDIYITGSNGYMLSGELATLLTGRYVELSMLPLSFSEYCSGAMEEGFSHQELFDHYMSSGSFPYILRYDLDVQEAREYLSGIIILCF